MITESVERGEALGNHLSELEFEIRRRSVRLLVFRELEGRNERKRFAFLKRDAPVELFPIELSDYAFSCADLDDVQFLLRLLRAWMPVESPQNEST
jgi:hypothetical protein